MGRESIDFSLHLSVIYCQVVSLLTKWLKEDYDLTYNEFSALYALLETEGPVSAENLADYMMLERASLRHILIALEDRGYVKKCSQAGDNRLMAVSLHSSRRNDVASMADNMEMFLEGEFSLSSHTNVNTSAIPSSMRESLDVLRGFAIPAVGMETRSGAGIFNSGFPIFWRSMTEHWDACARRCSSLTLNEYRVLQALDEQHTMSVKDMSDKLLLSKATVSDAKGVLVGKKLAQEKMSPFDARVLLVTISKKGRLTAQQVLGELNDLTRSVHVVGNDESIIDLQAWHALMYRDLRRRMQTENHG